VHGLVEESESREFRVDPVFRRLGKCRKEYRTELLNGNKAAATKAIEKTTKLIPTLDHFWVIPKFTISTINAFRGLGGEAAVAKYIAWLDGNRHADDVNTGSLWAMGLTDIATKRAQNLVIAHIKKLKRDSDTNIHFPVNEICEQLWFLMQTDHVELAAKLLQRLLNEMPKWPGLRGGFAASGVMTMLAELVAEIDSPEAALDFSGLADQAARAEPHRGFRKGAIKAAKQQAAAPGLTAKIEQARTIKNAKKRREKLIPLLTTQAAWPELAKVLDEITDPDELLDALHAVIYKLPGGARLA
jgi:hypothetical protein